MRLEYKRETPKQLSCSFCDGKLRAQTPSGGEREDPNFRCDKCTVRVVVTNQSYLPEEIRHYYWFLVKSLQLCIQEWR